jgi:predicted TPR repeat methyltransferase
MTQAGPDGVADTDARQAAAKALFLEGLAAFNDSRFESAEQCFVDSLERMPGRISTLLNLAATRLKLQRPVDAIAAADAVLAAEPRNVDALQLRAGALARLGLKEQALDAFDGALALDPSLADTWSQRGGLLREAGRLAEAAQAFEQAIARGGDAALNGYYLAAVRGTVPPDAAPAGYIEGLFDDYSASFEQHLIGSLCYRAHVVLIETLAAVRAGPFRSALDLGCGTGLCGALVKPRVGRLTGVDLAARMVARARERGVYDRLEQAEIVAWLGANHETFDLVVCTDVLIYFGDLAPVFAGVRQALATQGLFCFSVELSSDDDVKLKPSLRYAHSEHCLRELAARHGFAVVHLLHAPIREEERHPIDGLYGYLVAT